jgi:hypothetical protein
MKSVEERFLEKVFPVPISGCWIWYGATNKTGYGRFGIKSREVEFAHRAAWRIFKGNIPSGMFVCHHCDIPLCVNPSHLFIGTAADNNLDRAKKGRTVIPDASFASDETHQVAKLKNADVVEIRSSKKDKNILAKQYGVTPRAIWAARTRRTFKGVL